MYPMIEEKDILTGRVRSLRDESRKAYPYLCAERSQILTDYWKVSEGEPLYLRSAHAFEKILNGITIVIRDNALIVGDMCKYVRGCNFYPETRSEWIIKELDSLQGMPGNYTKVTDEEKKLVFEQSLYWKNKNCEFASNRIFSEKYGTLIDDLLESRVTIDHGPHSGNSRKILNHPLVLRYGLSGIIKKIEEKIKTSRLITYEELKAVELWKSMIITCNAVINFSKRYSRLAKEKAELEENPTRKQELEKIAEICNHVPENPPRTFWEALQCFWFVHIAAGLEGTMSGNSPGRFDQYMYPFYKKDIDGGIMNQKEAAELLGCLWVKFAEYYYLQKGSFAAIVQGTAAQNMTIGGIKPDDGSDASNELSYLILDVTQHMKLLQPTVSVRYNDKLNKDFLLKAAEVVSVGGGQPTFFNDKYAFSVLPQYGATQEEVRNWAPTGCVEANFPYSGALYWGAAMFALPKCLELVFHNGIEPYTKKLLGKKTGDSRNFTSMDQLWNAFEKQIEYIMEVGTFTSTHSHIHVPADYAPQIFNSVMTNDCIDKGKEYHRGGPRYTNLIVMSPVGVMTAADSLTAIRKLVFEKKAITLSELLDAIGANFKGYEEIHRMCLNAPKYGNDDDYADEMGQKVISTCNRLVKKFVNGYGEPIPNAFLGITAHYFHGVTTGATPDGRLAYVPYGDGSVSPVQGVDKNGPTAVIRSAGKIDAAPALSTLFNQKFHPSALKNKEDWSKFTSYLKTYFDMGGYHIQFNCINRETLIDAKKHPENYRDLVVRVAGFCLFFVEIDPSIQDEIIERTEQKWRM